MPHKDVRIWFAKPELVQDFHLQILPQSRQVCPEWDVSTCLSLIIERMLVTWNRGSNLCDVVEVTSRSIAASTYSAYWVGWDVFIGRMPWQNSGILIAGERYAQPRNQWQLSSRSRESGDVL